MGDQKEDPYCGEAFWGDSGCESDYGCYRDPSIGNCWTRRAIEESKSFSVDPGTGNQIIEHIVTRELKDFQINVDIPDDVFKIIFEKGTEVFDARTKKSYTVE